MSIHSIKEYQNEVEKIVQYGGTKKETAIRNAFYNLLNVYAKQKGFILVPEVTVMGANGRNVTPDGTLKDSLRQDWGYWESKDEADNIDDEIDKKFKKGYPKDNILFEDSKACVLIQNGTEVMRVNTADAVAVDRILNAFINYERPEVKNFREAIEHFKEDVPRVTDVLRKLIDEQEVKNAEYVKIRNEFLELCKESINPEIVKDDIREMMIQHILTEDIFNVIFDETQFHRENNIGKELEKVITTFFTGSTRRETLARIQHYYQVINTTAANIPDHHEKQKFLKVVYETFYKSYNPKAADRLGVVYTPNEIVKFMIESTDYLLHKHFGKFLEDKNVEILDPATGTGTYICDIIDYLKKDKVEYKYKNELHANEIAILPYYIANLNIEFTYKQKTGKYLEFENLCFVDTLENVGFSFKGKMDSLFSVSKENTERIKKQNEKKISIIIGNPPYNAVQHSENENNKNRKYPAIDKRLKDTFAHFSNTQNINRLYDPFVRFYRWAMDRIDNYGIISFITNRSFIDSRTFDGFRKIVEKDFDFAYIIDTKSDVRANPKIAGTTHNIFGIQTGVAIMFLVKHDINENEKSSCSIHFKELNDFWTKDEKLKWLTTNKLKKIDFTHIIPDKNSNWINLIENDYENLISVYSDKTKATKRKIEENSIFKTYSLGVNTARDEWAVEFSSENIAKKIKYLIKIYNYEREKNKETVILDNEFDIKIKWDDDLKKFLKRDIEIKFNKNNIIKSLHRPYINKFTYYDKYLNARQYQWPNIMQDGNIYITVPNLGSPKDFCSLASSKLINLNFHAGGAQCLPLYRIDENGSTTDNLTDWGLEQFRNNYKSKEISKEDIFYYVYGVLHNPAYRKKYELNLKREFPRIPFYDDFKKWRDWGKKLMDLHVNYETVKPFKLNVATAKLPNTGKGKKDLFDNKYENKIKAKLKADKINGSIELDEVTTISGIPKEAWEYKLGNRSALEWILDQYKEKKPTDPTIAEKFNTYRFADYKDQVIDLLKRVTTVSVETMKIIKEMEK